MRVCPLALIGFIGICFLAIAVFHAASRNAERMNTLVADAALASAEMYHHSQNSAPQMNHAGATSHSANEAMLLVTRDFRETHEKLTAAFSSNGWPDVAVYQAPLGYLAAALQIGRPSAEVSDLWRAPDGKASIDDLMREQLAVCRDLCMTPGLSGEDRAVRLAALNDIAIVTLIPELRKLRSAVSAWKNDLSYYSRAAIFTACLGLIFAILYTRFRVVAPLLSQLDRANMSLAGRNEQLEQMVEERTRDLSCALKDATSAHEARTRFLASVNHEMRTPLNGVLGIAALLGNTDLDDRQQKLVETIKRSGKTLVRLIDDVLDFVSLSTGQMALDLRPIELRELIEDTLGLLRPIAEEKGLRVLAQLPSSGADAVMADPERVAQVVHNLVGNAVKFTDTGHVTLRVQQTLNAGRAMVTIEVIDTGPGISDEKMKRLFVPFERRALGAPTKGTGLGLAITKSLVNQMGGKLDLTTEVGMGTHVTVNISFDLGEAEVFDAA